MSVAKDINVSFSLHQPEPSSKGYRAREVTEEDSSFDGVTEEEFYEALFDLVRNGLLRPTGEYRNGQPVYIATPEEEKSDEAKAYENKIKTRAELRNQAREQKSLADYSVATQ